MTQALISFEAVNYSAGQGLILENIHLDIGEHEITTIIGPNGAGKSCLIKLMCGILQASKGKILRHQQVRVGYMPQKLALDESLPINVDRFLSLTNADNPARQSAMAKTAVSHLHKRSMHKLSGGEFQRVLLARAICRRPNLLLLDEPLQGVDINGQAALYELIGSIRKEFNCAIVMVSHDLHLVMAQTQKVICLNKHICCHGQPDSVSQHPEYLRLFGPAAAENIAVYSHHHDHQHDMHGNVVDECNDDRHV